VAEKNESGRVSRENVGSLRCVTRWDFHSVRMLRDKGSASAHPQCGQVTSTVSWFGVGTGNRRGDDPRWKNVIMYDSGWWGLWNGPGHKSKAERA
jgi:hypothetical protein